MLKHYSCDETLYTLYSTNTILIERDAIMQGMLRQSLVRGAPRLLSPSIALITTLNVRSQLVLWRYPESSKDSQRDKEDRALFAEQLELLPRSFPNLKRLRWVPCGTLYNKDGPRTPVPGNEFDEVQSLFLRPLLRASARLPQLRELLVPVADTIFYGIINHLDRSKRQSFRIGQRLGDIRIWYPFTEQPGTPGPDGGGYWIEYHDSWAKGQKLELPFEGPVRYIEHYLW